MCDWSQLPADLVRNIEAKLVLYKYQIRLRCVCPSWRSALPKTPNQNPNVLPWLLVPLKSKTTTEIGKGPSFGFLDPLERKVHRIQLSDPESMLFRGSSHGWVVNIDEKNSICAMNPLTCSRVQLPPRSKFPDILYYRPDKHEHEYGLREMFSCPFYTLSEAGMRNRLMDKVILSSCPQSDPNFVAVAIYGEYSCLAYCRRGDKKWTFIDYGYEDIIFHEERLYGVRPNGKVMVCDIHGPSPTMTEFMPNLPLSTAWRFYIVKACVGLILVLRDVTEGEVIEGSESYDPEMLSPILYKTERFRIFKLDTNSKQSYRIKSVGDDMLFLGLNSTFSLSCKSLPGYTGNCIYFTDDYIPWHRPGVIGGFDIGIFNMTDGSIQRLPGYNANESDLLIWPPPVWFTPNLINQSQL